MMHPIEASEWTPIAKLRGRGAAPSYAKVAAGRRLSLIGPRLRCERGCSHLSGRSVFVRWPQRRARHLYACQIDSYPKSYDSSQQEAYATLAASWRALAMTLAPLLLSANLHGLPLTGMLWLPPVLFSSEVQCPLCFIRIVLSPINVVIICTSQHGSEQPGPRPGESY